MRGLWQALRNIAVLLVVLQGGQGCGASLHGTEVGNGDKKDPTTDPATDPAKQNTNAAEKPGAGSDTAPATADTASQNADTNSMIFLLADCGSPFADKVDGTFASAQTALTGAFLTASATDSKTVQATFLDNYTFKITQTGAGGIGVTATGFTLPASYQCANAATQENISYLGDKNVTMRSVSVTADSKTATVTWYQKKLAPSDKTPCVFRLEVLADGVTRVYARQ